MKKALSLLLVLAMILAVAPAVFASETNTLVMGDNELALSVEETEKSWTIEAAEAGMLKIEVTALSYYDAYDECMVDTPADYIDRMFWGSYGLSINGESQWSSTGYVDVEAGDEVTVTLYNYNYMETTMTLNVDYYVVPEGTRDNPKVLEDVGTYTVSLEADNSGYYYDWVATEAGTLTVAVSSESGWTYCVNNYGAYIYGETHWSDDDPVVSSEDVAVKAGETVSIFVATYDPADMWSNPAGDVTVTLSFEPAGESGSNEDGEAVDSGYASADEDSKKVILYTPAADGTLTITVGDGTAAWVSDVMNFSNYSTTEKVTGTDEASYTVEVKAGVTYAVRIYGQGDPCAAISDIPYTIVFNGEQAEETIDGTTVTLNTATYGDELEVPVEVTGSGTITIAICGDPGYRFWLKDANGNYLTNGITGKEAQTYTYDFTAAGEYSVVIQSYDKAGWGEGDGTVTYDISFAAGEVEVQVDKYVISGELALGENAVEMAENAENTLFMFTPEETGVYTFTGVDLSNWHTSFNPYITEGETPAATIEWTCTEVGQHVLIGITASGTITVEKTGEYVPSAELTMDWVEYDLENEAKEYVPATGANVVELKDSDTIVLGKDGYYHYGTANGPLVVIDLSADGELGISIIEAMANGRVGAYIYDENGTLIAKYDYGNTLVELQETGMTLLTDEILSIVKAVGYNSGWWTYMGIQDNENPWLVLCAYVEGTETPDANPATGDVIIAGAVIALMTSATGLVVTKKKFF